MTSDHVDDSLPPEPVKLMRVTLTDDDVEKIISLAGATLRPQSSAKTLATTLAFYEMFLANHPLATEPNLGNLLHLQGRQLKALESIHEHLKEVWKIFANTDKHHRAAGLRWLHQVRIMRESDGQSLLTPADMSRHLRALAFAAEVALSEPDEFLIHWIMQGVKNPRRVMDSLEKAKIAELLEHARAIMKREPHVRAGMLIGRAIEEHIKNGLLGTGGEGSPKGPALTLGLLIAKAWGIEPTPSEDSLRKAWRALPERMPTHPVGKEGEARRRR